MFHVLYIHVFPLCYCFEIRNETSFNGIKKLHNETFQARLKDSLNTTVFRHDAIAM